MNSDSSSSLIIDEQVFSHLPVLPQEVIAGLAVSGGGHYLDTTVGGGGHSRLILQTAPDVQLTAIDQDEDALAAAKKELAEFGDRVKFIQSNFAAYQFPDATFNGILADLGVSSYQLDTPERGFSFRHTASLDMRMNQQASLTAADVINEWEEAELADIFFKYGEERLSRRIARRIVERRPFDTTTALAEAIASAVPPKYRYGRIHPATRAFQALRIVVNDELESLETFLAKAPNALVPGGRIAVISFHSLEDRLVKHGLRNSPLLRVITKKPITAQELEISNNPRSRSAKLRIAERVN
ncbi:16S rRNA (cytosine(1402)-N(4))-methyltransferase RsmH [Nostoc sp. FACHB-87]|uniref:16S rRNA (cytosine(1402)-N(4))-methyltransferase RsmH n=1 Tax=Nostocaceae TaxID=1162 RepID=UPI0016876748|nr:MULTISPECIES: 16S rRNA (cytosine(1402)-N(4))-methyltransferase RsmH [Nostocaceae]MBD2300790.1 16S rRNA (cytosine(1402)-N(4))-methyltransferase RsmH [Nostoc sp. FACHB-190]MBD2455282.1 16S rRNA (cytosine(1402)-N(4))-methyltransferase RsmH [Nostoc sp. FACHB-87]MBD2476893.1 16S rRNA (cytosine(1402)-N(4))-methyltransferase RsmH [Anabaena sp. FACHB-83]